jgi:hypothetical protein
MVVMVRGSGFGGGGVGNIRGTGKEWFENFHGGTRTGGIGSKGVNEGLDIGGIWIA